MILAEHERAFLLRRRIGHLATSDASAIPTVMPVCFALEADRLYTAVDDKPKRQRRLRRIRDLETNPHAAFVADRYDDDWSRLGWVMVRGTGRVLHSGAEFDHGCELLRGRYPQYAGMTLCPLIAIDVLETHSWGNLDG